MSVVILLLGFFFGSIFLFSHFSRAEDVVANHVVISEVRVTGGTGKTNDEFVELYNPTDQPIDISGWRLAKLTKLAGPTEYVDLVGVFPTTTPTRIETKSYFLIAHTGYEVTNNVEPDIIYSNNAISNDNTVVLLDTAGVIVDLVGWGDANNFEGGDDEAANAQTDANPSIERKPGGSLGNGQDTDNNKNDFTRAPSSPQNADSQPLPQPNTAPVALFMISTSSANVGTNITFDATGSSDSDGTIASYAWDFGNTQTGAGVIVSYTYMATGTFNITLTVTDDKSGVDKVTQSVIIAEAATNFNQPTISSTTTSGLAILINELLFDPNSGEKEWIELYNASTSTVDLTGWTLHDGVGQIAAPTSSLAVGGYFVVELSSSKLNNSGDQITLKNSIGEIIDQIGYGDFNDGNKTDNAPVVAKGNTLARIGTSQNTGNDKNDFTETTTPTLGGANAITAPVSPAPSGSGSGPSTGSGSPTAADNWAAGEIVINELVSDPADDKEEFIELFNTTYKTINLMNWFIEDGSETKTILSGTIASRTWFVIEKPKGSLNNAGDLVRLVSPGGKEIDRLTYGTWDDGNVADNARTANDPSSLARKVDGQDSGNDYYDFVVTATLTKGAKNVISQISEKGEVMPQLIESGSIIINEVLPNPKGSDNSEEFIEVKNKGKITVSLVGWKLGDSSDSRYAITQATVQPGGLVVFKRVITGIALNNTGGEEVKLFGPNGTLIDSVKYTGSAEEGVSYARREDETWVWTTAVTAGKENVVAGKSAAPKIALEVDTEVLLKKPVTFDASDTTDPEGEKMTFLWDFTDGDTDEGDRVEHIFRKVGTYKVALTVIDASGNEAKQQVIIKVSTQKQAVGGNLVLDLVRKVQFNEILPNPNGSDEVEYVELFNPTSFDIELSGMKLDDEDGGSRPYIIPENVIIKPQEYMVISRRDSGVTLNNTEDEVRLLYPDNSLILKVAFEEIKEGNAYAINPEGSWEWTTTPTPGEPNIITAPVEKVKSVSIRARSAKSKVKPLIETTLEKIKDFDVGDRVKVTGIVAVLPSVFGSQYFYIVTADGRSGVQVYMNKKNFPKLAIGDRVEVTGELSDISGETRLKTSQKSDINVIDHVSAPLALAIAVENINEPYQGGLVQVQGEITELKTTYMYVDDGTEEVKIYFKRGAAISKQNLKEGDLVSVVGIVSQTKNGYQILPRSSADIMKTGVSENIIATADDKSAEDVAETYLTATAGGLTSILIGLLAKARGAMAVGLMKKVVVATAMVIRRRKG